LNGATSGYRDAFDLVNPYVSQSDVGDLVATGKASGLYIGASAAVNTQPDMYLYRSVPKIELCTINTTTCGVVPTGRAMTLTSNTEVMRVKITADSAGQIDFTSGNSNILRFTLSGRAADDIDTDTTVTIKNVTDSTTLDSITTDVSDIVSGTNGYTLSCDFAAALQIAAGQSKIVSLELDTTDFGTAYDSLQARIANAAGDLVWGDTTTAGATISNNTFFTWLPLVGDTFTTNP